MDVVLIRTLLCDVCILAPDFWKIPEYLKSDPDFGSRTLPVA